MSQDSYKGTPFSFVGTDTATGKPLSPEALETRERLVLLWKIAQEKNDCLREDLLLAENQTEAALTGEEAADLFGNLMEWNTVTLRLPRAPIDFLRDLGSVAVSDARNGE